MDKYYLDINLRRWAIIQYSSHTWNHPELKKRLARTSINSPIRKTDTVPIALREHLDKLILPSRDKNELKFAIGITGTRIRKFLQDLTEFHNDHRSWIDFIKYIDHIHWNHLGCIDMTQTHKSLYQSGLLPMTYDTWYRLCRYCIEECIIDFWIKMTKNCRYNELMEEICTSNSSHSCFYWRLHMQKNLEIFGDVIDNFDNSETVDEFMFKKHDNNYETFVYFWNRLKEGQKTSVLRQMAVSSKINEDDWTEEIWGDDIDSFMFFIRQLSIYGFEQVLSEMLQSSSLLMDMLIWPCEINFMSALEESCNNNNNSFKWTPIRAGLLDLMALERAYIGSDSRARKWFCCIWINRAVFTMTEEMIVDSVRHICRDQDLEMLKFVVINQKSWVDREKILETVVGFYRHFGWFFLRKFVDEISSEIDVRDWFDKKVTDEIVHKYVFRRK